MTTLCACLIIAIFSITVAYCIFILRPSKQESTQEQYEWERCVTCNQLHAVKKA